MEVRRGTPVVAITDMKVIKIEDSSAEQRSTSYLKDKYGVVAGKDHYTGGKELIKPFDALRIYFLDTNGNIILYYHLHETPLVPGFKKGKCKIPLQYEMGRKKMKPEDCGGYSEDLIKNNFNVKKGQVIEVFVEKLEDREGNVKVSHEKAIKMKSWEKLQKLYEIVVSTLTLLLQKVIKTT